MLARRLRRRPNIKSALVWRIVSARLRASQSLSKLCGIWRVCRHNPVCSAQLDNMLLWGGFAHTQ